MTRTTGTLPVGLRDAQRLLYDAVVADGPPDFDLESRLGALVVDAGLSAPYRVAIYRDGYRARLVECLADDYPAVQALLGEEAFGVLCHGYIRDVPPGISLNDYGARFADYCQEHSPLHPVFVAELAQLEWALVKAVHASDARKLEPEALAQLSLGDWQSAALVPSPTLTLLATSYPVNGYLQAWRDGQAPDPPSPAPSSVIVCRRGVDVWRIDLPAHLGSIFASLVAGDPLAETLAKGASDVFATAEHADHSVAISSAFSQWMRAGCFAEVARAQGG